MNNQSTIKHIIFDLGGVLIEISGISEIIEWSGNIHSEKQLWQRWTNSPAIRSFESGQTEVNDFVKDICQEFEISIDSEYFLNRFLKWPQGPYPDVKPFLKQLKQHISFSCLSNTNFLHWEKMRDEMKLATFFSHTFLSFEIGMFKPDNEIYKFVASQLPYLPEEILFFDDNQINVDGARSFGFKSEKVVGVKEIKHQLDLYQIPYYQ
jgi:glucose-1-phosphatase